MDEMEREENKKYIHGWVMTKQQTWNDILASMIKVRDQHGWYEAE
jgi:hypothetical protein